MMDPSSAEAERPKKLGVLVVDDDPDMRKIVRIALEGGIFGPFWEAADGETALHSAFRHRPDIVILDYTLPGIDGLAVERSMRMMSPNSKVVLLTGSLQSKPSWADLHLEKTEVARLREILEEEFG